MYVLTKKPGSIIAAISIGVIILFTSYIQPVAAQADSPAAQANIDQALCLPGLQVAETGNCLLAGPAKKLQDLASLGITYPAEPLVASSTPLALSNIPFSYARVTKDAVPLYASVEDAQNNIVKEELAAGKIKYISYSQHVTTDQGVFYQLATEDEFDQNWINADAITKVSIPIFQGYLIKQVPPVPFAWVRDETTSRKTPGYASEKTGKTYYRLNIVRCYDSKVVDNVEWVMIGPDEWIDHKFLNRVLNSLTPPAGVTNGRWIEVNLYEQVLTVYDQGKMVFATLISSGGAPFYTQPGTFHINKKVEHEYMTGTFEADHSDYYYLAEVPYIMYFDQARALHGAYWNNYLGNAGSHGCVNLSVGDSHWLYDWANEGDTVYVRDPSGKTPTDPSLYGAGGF